MKKLANIAGMASLFVGSFLFFAYLMFPYEVLKETISSQISKEVGFNVHINELSPAFPFGLDLENVSVSALRGGASLQLSQISLTLNPLAIFLGRIAPRLDIDQGTAGGSFRAGANIGLLDAIKGNPMPRRIFFESQGFKLDELFKFLFTWQASLPETNPIVVDLLRDLSVVGSMNAQLDLDLDHTNVTASEGKLILNLIEAAIRLGNVELAIKDQILQKAFISATMKRGELTFDENSGLSSEGLDILVNGKIKLNPNIFSSLFEMLIDLKIKDDIRENYGFILDAVTQRISNGEIRIQIRGSLGSPEVKTI